MQDCHASLVRHQRLQKLSRKSAARMKTARRGTALPEVSEI
jgi:hypothetical protein